MASVRTADSRPEKEAIGFYGYYGQYATFVSVDKHHGGTTHLLRYDVDKKTLHNDVHKKVAHRRRYLECDDGWEIWVLHWELWEGYEV